MIIIVIGIIAFILFFFIICKDDELDPDTLKTSIIGSIIVSASIGVMALIVGQGIVQNTTTFDDLVVAESGPRTELIALKDNYQINGKSFIFSTTINSELEYNYLYNTAIGITSGSVKASEAYIQYIGVNETPYIQIKTLRNKNKLLNWLFNYNFDVYVIYLPEGSVIENEYQIDLE